MATELPREAGTPERTCYRLESLIPSWLARDQGYRAALRQHLIDRMALQGYKIVSEVAIKHAGGQVPPPVGMALLEASVWVEEFDVEVPLDGEQ